MKPVCIDIIGSINMGISCNKIILSVGVPLVLLAGCSSSNGTPRDECTTSVDLRTTSSDVVINGVESITAGRIVHFPDDIENPYQFFSLSEGETVALDDLALQVLMSYDNESSTAIKMEESKLESFFNIFISAARASCLPDSSSQYPSVSSSNMLSSINVISDTDINVNNSAGNELNGIMSIITQVRFAGNNVSPADPNTSIELTDFTSATPNIPLAFSLMFDEVAVETSTIHQFNISVLLTTGQAYSLDTLPIAINP